MKQSYIHAQAIDSKIFNWSLETKSGQQLQLALTTQIQNVKNKMNTCLTQDIYW
jgi:hypothetical protein